MVNFLVDENPNRLVSRNADFGLLVTGTSELIPAPGGNGRIGIHQLYLGVNDGSGNAVEWTLLSDSTQAFGGFASGGNALPVEWDYSPWPWYFGEEGQAVEVERGSDSADTTVAFRIFVTYAVYHPTEL